MNCNHHVELFLSTPSKNQQIRLPISMFDFGNLEFLASASYILSYHLCLYIYIFFDLSYFCRSLVELDSRFMADKGSQVSN